MINRFQSLYWYWSLSLVGLFFTHTQLPMVSPRWFMGRLSSGVMHLFWGLGHTQTLNHLTAPCYSAVEWWRPKCVSHLRVLAVNHQLWFREFACRVNIGFLDGRPQFKDNHLWWSGEWKVQNEFILPAWGWPLIYNGDVHYGEAVLQRCVAIKGNDERISVSRPPRGFRH